MGNDWLSELCKIYIYVLISVHRKQLERISDLFRTVMVHLLTFSSFCFLVSTFNTIPLNTNFTTRSCLLELLSISFLGIFLESLSSHSFSVLTLVSLTVFPHRVFFKHPLNYSSLFTPSMASPY